MAIDSYKYRPNGNYLIRRECELCGTIYDVHALANRPNDDIDLCTKCRCAVDETGRIGAETERQRARKHSVAVEVVRSVIQ